MWSIQLMLVVIYIERETRQQLYRTDIYWGFEKSMKWILLWYMVIWFHMCYIESLHSFWIQSEHPRAKHIYSGLSEKDGEFYWEKNHNRASLICSLSNPYIDLRMITLTALFSLGSKSFGSYKWSLSDRWRTL